MCHYIQYAYHRREKFMKKYLLMLITLFIFVLPATNVNAANPKYVLLKNNKTYTQYDVTGDGKKDTFKYIVYPRDSKQWGYTRLYLNGKKTNNIFTAKGCSGVYLCSFSKKDVFLLPNFGVYGGCEVSVYKYTEGKFKSLFSGSAFFNDSSYIGASRFQTKKLANNLLIVNHALQRPWHIKNALTFKHAYRTLSWDMKYKATKGKICLSSNIATVVGTETFTALSTFKTSSRTPSNKYDSFQVKKGDKVKLTKIYFPGSRKKAWYRIKKGAKYGWFEDSSKRLLK